MTLDILSSGSSGSTDTHGPSPDERSTKSNQKGLRFKSSTPLPKYSQERSSTDTLPSETVDLANHPQNHMKLKAAWDSMLASRFISNKVLSILPFYLSTLFSGLEIYNLYTVPLPGNTPLEHGVGDDDDSLYSFPRPRHRPPQKNPTVNIDSNNLINHPIITELPRLQAMDSQELAGMHLHRVVHFIKSCKETIRQEYYKLYPEDKSVRPSARVQKQFGNDIMGMVYPGAQPESFDIEWCDWIQ